MTKRRKKFTGIRFDLFNLRATEFDGYGITFFEIGWTWADGITISNNCCLFSLNFYLDTDKKGKVLQLYGEILFGLLHGIIWKRVLVPQKDRCLLCDEYCETHEFYLGDKPYCSHYCKENDD